MKEGTGMSFTMDNREMQSRMSLLWIGLCEYSKFRIE